MNQQQQIEKMEILLSGGVVLLDHAMDKSENAGKLDEQLKDYE